MPRVKKIPQRMCVGCQEMKPKRKLIRLVRTPDDTIEIDLTGKRSGRGAYICPGEDCFKKAVKGKKLEKALKSPISSEVFDALAKELMKVSGH
ncbi:YlxR family protein [Pelotomaculum terephthalicicum JT]|uniref:RNase P modulator RnpM n=1 Tax=Pelotomaculum TaxID=191373 RepID=UPI0009C8A331|nr:MULTISPECIES: YlxR family protein [Pelotomaculum]MCG9967766.1 YlxR family protein [Pelotomaculum terephthalicicum JT]OPX85384.1 MAG: hypothetical protein A4E54_02432 [Pelotomaculum sp. PtaB.Bin117]OPY62683.1 MAG: hypothetical protein A4E56_01137 [Pelotomaculum sp. PtaU1.Bin065]